MHPDKFLKSLDNQKFSEGKSGSFFCFSPDKSFILKTIPESEAILLKKILPSYYMVSSDLFSLLTSTVFELKS